jgi:hypothetical protein
MSRKTFAQVKGEQRKADIDEVVSRLQTMGLSQEAEAIRRAMTGEWRVTWPYLDETRHSLQDISL